jgi:hypothetical protein
MKLLKEVFKNKIDIEFKFITTILSFFLNDTRFNKENKPTLDQNLFEFIIEESKKVNLNVIFVKLQTSVYHEPEYNPLPDSDSDSDSDIDSDSDYDYETESESYIVLIYSFNIKKFFFYPNINNITEYVIGRRLTCVQNFHHIYSLT